jgi:hypothetical protein
LVIVLGIVAIAVNGSKSNNGSNNASTSAPRTVLPGTSGTPTPSPGASAPGIPNGSNLPSTPGGSGAAGATTGPLDSYLLSPAEVGATGMDLIDGGRGVTPADATLDWCGKSYPSDSSRTGRVQVEYEGTDQFVSNEFVKYSPNATAIAYQEIKAAVASCQPSFEDSGTETNQIQVAAHSSSLVTDQVTVSAFEQGQVALWTAVVYQFDGNYFSGVYVSGATRADVLQLAQHLAVDAAVHLRQAVAGTRGSGGGVVASPAPEASGSSGGGGVQT